MRLSYILFFFTLLLVMGCGGGSPPTKTVVDISLEDKAGRVIIDSQGTVIFGPKEIEVSGAPLNGFFIQDDNIIGKATIEAFIQDQGANVNGGRVSNYYPLNLAKLMENNNIFSGPFWRNDQAASRLVDMEQDNLNLDLYTPLLNDRNKAFTFEPERVCIQGGKMLSNLIYYRSEYYSGYGCYGNGDGTCKPSFATFPLFKTCSSLSNLKDTIEISNIWNDYSISCNYNSNFATLPSFTYQTNIGYSYCHFKNLDRSNSHDSIIIGHGVGNSQIEGKSSNLELDVEGLFESMNVGSSDIQFLGTVDLRFKGIEQRMVDMGKSQAIYTGDDEDGDPMYDFIAWNSASLRASFESGNVTPSEEGSWELLVNPIVGTQNPSSHQNMVSSNYLLMESIAPKVISVNKSKVTTDDNNQYYVYTNNYNDWYLIANFDVNIDTIFNEYGTPQVASGFFFSTTYYDDIGIPARTPERLFIQKKIGSSTYTLTEESETLKYKTQIFLPENSYSRFPVYTLRITNVDSDFCDKYFSLYDYRNDIVLPYDESGDSMSCKVVGGTVTIILNERLFSLDYSSTGEYGGGYLLLREILYP